MTVPAVGELVRAAARRTPDAPAVVGAGTTLTYAELLRRAAAVTGALRREVGPGVVGRPVVVRADPGPVQVAALLGVLDAGAHLLCVGAGDRGERVTTVLTDMGAVAVLTETDPGGDAALAASAVPVLPLGAVRPLPMGEPAPVDGADLAYVACTSGTSGRSKGIPHTHATLAQFVTWYAGEFGLRPGARLAQWSPPGYDAALVEIFAPLVAGATVCTVTDRMRADPEKLAVWLEEQRITHFQSVPSFAGPLLGAVAQRPPTDARPAVVLLAGEVLSPALARTAHRTWPGLRLVNLYGPTETVIVTSHDVPDPGPAGPGAPDPAGVPIGTAVPEREVLVVDGHDRPCGPGEEGEIVIVSPHVTRGYLGRVDPAAAAAFRPLAGRADEARCYRTGDTARVRPDGVLEFVGRGDHQVKIGGMRLELGGVEATIGAHPDVAACAVVPLTADDGRVTRLVAFVTCRSGADPEQLPGLLRRHLSHTYGGTRLPLTVRLLDPLPRNLGGKVDRRRLPALASAAAPQAGPVHRQEDREGEI